MDKIAFFGGDVCAFLSHRHHGNMSLSALLRDDFAVTANRNTFFHLCQLDGELVTNAGVGDGTEIFHILNPQHYVERVDGLNTTKPLPLSITYADCTPLIIVVKIALKLYHVGIVHCGWRNIHAGILENMIVQMNLSQETVASARVYIGPGLCPRCYAFSRSEFDAQGMGRRFVTSRHSNGSTVFLDIQSTIIKMLAANSFRSNQILCSGDCTQCTRIPDGSRKYYSWRGGDVDAYGNPMTNIGVVCIR